MKRGIAVLTLSILLFQLITIVAAPSPLTSTVLRFDPATVELGLTYCVGEAFTLIAGIDDVEDLAGFGLQVTWNTTYLEYVSHTIIMPVEDYPGGLIHKPILITADMLNEPQGTYDCAAFTLGGAPFNGSGSAFEITLRVKTQPNTSEPDITFPIEFTLDALSSPFSAIPHSVQNCNVTIKALWNQADVNDDLKVDIFDVVKCGRVYLIGVGDPFYCSRCDISEVYGKIDIFDIVMICTSYGEEYTP